MDNLFIPVLLVAVVFGCFTNAVAESKGHYGTAWFFGGLVFGPIALLASLGLPDLRLRGYIRRIAEHQGAWDAPQSPLQDWDKDPDS